MEADRISRSRKRREARIPMQSEDPEKNYVISLHLPFNACIRFNDVHLYIHTYIHTFVWIVSSHNYLSLGIHSCCNIYIIWFQLFIYFEGFHVRINIPPMTNV